jgi:UDPglucose--hexose-1-phosphate uridylyltransferase
MPELRQNIATKEWVIIASERAKRPNSYTEPKDRTITEDRLPHDPTCPFCIGNEERDLEIESFPDPDNWQTRVVKNKYPALAGEGLPVRIVDGVHRRIDGVGYHEVVVLHPSHNTTLALMQPHEIQAGLETMQRRGREIARDQRIEQIIMFKNHGERAGASLVHPHSQIVALPVVPSSIRSRLLEARRYFDDTGMCVFSVMLEDELSHGSRLVTVSDYFVAFSLYAAASPFHIWIIPRHGGASFLDATTEEMADLGVVLRDVLYRIYVGLRDPDYNLVVRSAPAKDRGNCYFRWYLTLIPRLSRMAGFELGSGMHINPTLPEGCAAFLRDLDV